MAGQERIAVATVTALGLMTAVSVAGLAMHGSSLAATSVPATASSTVLNSATESAATTAGPSVVRIESARGVGSGVIIDARGYIVTNYHVLFGSVANVPARSYTVTLSDGRRLKATIAGTAAPDDLAVLRVHAARLHEIKLANSNDLRVGEFALAIGNPLGFGQSATLGIVSTLDRNVFENGPATVIPNMIQISAPINPGNSGGALVDLNGRLAGIPTLAAIDPTFGAAAQGIGFAIPSNRVAVITAQIIQGGKVVHSGRPYLGIASLREVAPDVADELGLAVQSGMLISVVVPGAPADQVGLRPGDVIVRIDGYAISDQEDFANAIAGLKPGQKVPVTVIGPSGKRTVMVTLAELPVPSS
jgi:S1-C subfamily serine protease